MTVVLMDSRISQGILCEICDWTLLPGSCLEEHNSGLVHQTLFDAVARLAPDKFLEFRDVVISSSRKKSKYALKILNLLIVFFANRKIRSYKPDGHALACSISHP